MTGSRDGQVARIPSGRLRQLGPINWVIAKLAARTVRAPEMHLFTTLGQRQTAVLGVVDLRRAAAAGAAAAGSIPNW